jgi:ribosomal protein S27E
MRDSSRIGIEWQPVGKASDWLREERRKTLGDWVAFCPGCGHTQRYFDESEDELPVACPQCGANLRSHCTACDARFSSAFAVECEACGAPLRANEQFGVRIRKK